MGERFFCFCLFSGVWFDRMVIHILFTNLYWALYVVPYRPIKNHIFKISQLIIHLQCFLNVSTVRK